MIQMTLLLPPYVYTSSHDLKWCQASSVLHGIHGCVVLDLHYLQAHVRTELVMTLPLAACAVIHDSS